MCESGVFVMKQTKRILAILLALALGLALMVPAGAADMDAPIFTKRMPLAIVARAGKSVALEVQARVPSGVTAELKYQWYASEDYLEMLYMEGFLETLTQEDLEQWDYEPIEGATERKYTALPPENGLYVRAYHVQAYYETEDGSIAESSDYILVIHFFSMFSGFNEAGVPFWQISVGLIATLPYSIAILFASVVVQFNFWRIVRTLNK